MTGSVLNVARDDVEVPCLDGERRRYVDLDAAASTRALPAVAARVNDFLPWYSSVHRGTGYKSRMATDAYERARSAALGFAGRSAGAGDIAVFCRNTTEAINQLAYRLRFAPDDVVVTTVVEHHANLLPWARVARRRFVECGSDGTFGVDDVVAALAAGPEPRALGDHGGVERDRLVATDRRDRGGRPRAWGARVPRRRPARAAPTAAAGGRFRRLERSQDVRAVRRRRPRRSASGVRRR